MTDIAKQPDLSNIAPPPAATPKVDDTPKPAEDKAKSSQEPQVVPQVLPPLPHVNLSNTHKFDDDPTLYIKGWILSLLYWEKPVRSGGFFAVLMGVLILTQYYSLLQMAAAFFTVVTGLNWVYVNTHKQGQRVFGGKSSDALSNPHHQRLESKATYIPKDRVLRTGELTVDVVEAVVQQLTKLVLIQDSLQSAWAVGIAYLVWTLAAYISTKYLVGLFIVGAFSLPKLYQQNQEVIDKQVAHYAHHGRQLASDCSAKASAKAKEVYGLAVATLTKKTKKAD
ncbi:Reticulon-domain-containing protein [Fennellomyces sp. T-0311]|nr:Reticulon-domain-containing protein [Fennellomyces sp. T-0311]